MPTLVQSASGTAASGNTVTVTLSSNTTAGNCLVVCAGARRGSTNPVVSTITIGGSADNFAVAKQQDVNSATDCEIWADPNCTGGQTSVVVTWTGGVGTDLGRAVQVMEWSGIATSSPVDQVAGQSATSSSWSSTTTGTLAQASEVVIGAVCCVSVTVTGPSSPWTNFSQVNSGSGTDLLAGYQVVSSTAGQSYAGSFNTNSIYSAAIVTLKAPTGTSGPAFTQAVTPARARIPQNGPRGRTSGNKGAPVNNPVPGPPIGPAAYQSRAAYQQRPAKSYPRMHGAPGIWSAPPPPAAAVVNQWANSYGQGTTFTTITSALQSCVVPLTMAYSVGGGSGTPTAGNWLFCIASWTQTPAITQVHVGVADDIHSWWREYPASSATGNVRTSISYTPNLASVPGNVYVAPDGEIAAINVLVVEVSGLGPWDTVGTGYPVTGYAAAATSLTLAGGAPGASAFFIAGAGGDNVSSGQAFLPAGWTGLSSRSQTDGADNLADNILTSAYLASSSASQSVTATASSAEDLSGFMIAVWTTGTNPVPAAQNPAWPYMKFEAAFGGGFNTADSELTWSDLSSRLWHWDESTGIQFQLGEVQATNLTIELDNFDAALSPLNVGSAYYSNALNSNMSFQSAVSPWTATNSATLAQSSAQAYASAFQAKAAYSLQVTPDGSHSLPGAISEKEAVTGSTAYTASAWFYSAAGYATGAEVALTWYTSGGATISTSTSGAVAIPAATWTQVTYTATSPSNAATAALTVQFAGTPSATPYYVAEAAFVTGSSAVSTGLVSPGTPVRLRAAMSVIGGVTVNRWYVIQRTAMQWEERITEARRRYVQATCTDLWAALSAAPPTFYRAEVYEDAPYAWWPCDDAPGNANVLPTSLRNVALGNTNPLNVVIAPGGATAQNAYNSHGQQATAGIEGNPPGVATYAAGTNAGWMFGDPESQTASFASEGGAVTATPGSASWQALGQLGTGGSSGWCLIANDANFPPLSGGVTIEIWFNYAFYASSTGYSPSPSSQQFYPLLTQPYNTPLTIWEILTGSGTVCKLQLDTNGHLNFVTGVTQHSVWASSDLRSNSWHMATVTLTTSSWQVWLDGGANANVSGSASLTSAWSWIVANGDLNGNGGSATGAGLRNGGNAALSHIAIYPYVLPYYRVLTHYWAGVSAFGQLPAPTGTQITWTVDASPASGSNTQSDLFAPDGSSGYAAGAYGSTNGVSASAVLATTAPGGITSGPSAWVVGTGQFASGTGPNKMFLWITWNFLGPAAALYTSANVGQETGAANVYGSGDSFNSGFGAAASGAGVCQGPGRPSGSPPAAASSIGDTAGQRIERLMRYGRTPSPNRCIDPAPLLVVAPGSAGAGQQAGTAIQAIQQSDGGLLFVDSLNHLTYWSKTHLGSQYSTPVWTITPHAPPESGAPLSAIPYYMDVEWVEDPQQVANVIQIEPVSPTGATLPLITPTNTAAVEASQTRWGAQPLQITSYLQSSAEQQTQANWLFTNFGQPQRRIQNMRIVASAYPAAFPMVLAINIGDVIQVTDWQVGGGGLTYTYRVNQIERRISGGGRNVINAGAESADQIAEVVIQAVFEPTSYWS